MTPQSVRDHRAALYRSLDAVNAMSAEASMLRLPLWQRISIRLDADDIRTQIRICDRVLARLARAGGHGIPHEQLGGTALLAPSSNRVATGCRGGTPAGMGHGCPAPVTAQRASAADAAPVDLNGREHNHADDLLFFASKSKNLQVGESHVTINAAGENNL